MLSDYSSLIEVITAVYFSMCIDDVLKGIWTPKYHEKVNAVIENSNVAIGEQMKRDFNSYTQKTADVIKRHMKIKSSFMLYVCILSLFLLGMEGHIDSFRQTGNEVELLLRSTLLLTIVLFLGRLFFKKYSRMAISCVLFPALVGMSYVFDFSISDVWGISENFVVSCFIVILLIPILWQIFLCWTHSSLYYGYLREKTDKERHLYDLAMLGFRTGQVAIVPGAYMESVVREMDRLKDLPQEDANKQDTPLLLINRTFIERMENVCRHPNAIRLFFSDIRYHFNRLRHLNNSDSEHKVATTDAVFEHMLPSDRIPYFNEHKSINS